MAERSGGRDSKVRDVAFIAAMLVVVSVLHLFTDPGQIELHGLYRRLYYLPIVYAAFVFGLRGGLVTAIAASVLFGPHAVLSLGGLFGEYGDNVSEILMYLVFGGLFGWLRDVEERRTADLRQVSKKLEDAYRKLEERAVQLINIQDYTQSILRSITSGVVTVGPDGSVATANPAAERILGMSEGEMVPKSIANLLVDDGGLGSDVRKVLRGRMPKTARDLTLVTRNGKVVHAQASASRMRDVGGHTIGAVVTIEDVSEVRTLTEQLMRADRLAAMGQLTAGVAHEVRNPLGIIRASVQLLEERRSEERMREATRVIKQEIDRLDRVIKALLDFGRPSAPTLVPTDVREVVKEVVLFTRKFASRANVEIAETYDIGLPRVMADPDQLKQVFVNLISNAVHAMERHGGVLQVAVRGSAGFVSASFEDNGPGIPRDRLGKVFDPFYSTRDDGTGLGLTIVHRIVDEHDGHVEVRSERGEGSVFTVSFPLLQEERTAAARRERRDSADEGA